MINVTRPYLPPLEKYVGYLQRIWDRNHLTNQGPVLTSLEERLREYLGVKHLMVVSNGTIALQLAIKALDLQGEIITTPFSYVATTNSILWEKCTPRFVDIRPEDFNLDPDLIEAAITEHTTAIMAVHVYGYPCDVERIQSIASRHNLRVIYDGAHAFGVKWQNRSLLDYGDVSTLSFHATKLFHTVEGGAVIARDPEVLNRMKRYATFGHVGDDYYCVGVNGKMNEFAAAMGHCVLDDMDHILRTRKEICEQYDALLSSSQVQVVKSRFSKSLGWNYAYYPILFPNELSLLKAISRLNTLGIFPRRYFYPTLNELPFVNGESCPVSEDVAKRVLCLPLYPGLKEEEQASVVSTILNSFR